MGLVKTNDNCIGCNRCIKVCSSMGANVAVEKGKDNIIDVDPKRCIACGACLDVCEHKAREYEDDVERFFEDLSKGVKISVLIAPAFLANYPKEYEMYLGMLKKLGVNRFISVSFGADITTWGYIRYITENKFYGGISQPCPAVVGYIERYMPELIDKLMPVQSPMMCSAIYLNKYMKVSDKLAFISPCIAKKNEIDDPNNRGYVSYNLTFSHLVKYLKEHPVSGATPYKDEIEYGLGSIYPMPGGLKENVYWLLGEDALVRQMGPRAFRVRRIRGRVDRAVVGTVNQILAVVGNVGVVVDLVDALVQLFLDLLAVGVGVRVVRRVDDFFLQGLQDLNRRGDRALSNLHHAVAVLGVAVVLVQRTDLDAHALGNRITGSVVSCAVDAHAARDFLQALRQSAVILVQRVQSVDRRHVVLYYHTCHDFFLLEGFLPFSLFLWGKSVPPSVDPLLHLSAALPAP